MARYDPTPDELDKAYRTALAEVSSRFAFFDAEELPTAAAIERVLARYRIHKLSEKVVSEIASQICTRRFAPGQVLLDVLKQGPRGRGPIAKPASSIAASLDACASELERIGRPWSAAFRDAVLRIADTRLPVRNLRRDAHAAGELLRALRQAAEISDSSSGGNRNFRAWVERFVRPLLEEEGQVLEGYAGCASEPVTELRKLVTVYDSDDFLGLGRPASNRELAVFCLLCGAITPKGSHRRKPSYGDSIRYAQSVVIKARRRTGLLALKENPESLEFPSASHRRHAHLLAVEDLRRAGFVPRPPAA